MISLITKLLIFILSYLFIVLPALPIIPLLYASVQHSKLAFSPNQLRISHVTLIIILLLLKPLLRLLGLVPPLEPNPLMKDFSEAFTLPDLSVSMPLIVKRADVQLYNRAVSTTKASGTLAPRTDPIFLLVGVSEPLMLLLLPKTNCPIMPLGSVNVRNRIEFLEPDICRRAASGGLRNAQARSFLSKKGRRVKRGMEFDMVVEVTSEVECTTDQRTIFRQVFTTLQYLKNNTKPQFVERVQSDKPVATDQTTHSSLRRIEQDLGIEIDAPKSWAAICKDYNPIHTSDWAARAFGFPGRLAHGNLVVARTLEMLRSVTDSVFAQMIDHTSDPFWLEVEFKRPMILPIALHVLFGEEGRPSSKKGHFQVKKEEKVCIEGEVGWL